MVRGEGLEPTPGTGPDPKSGASANSAILAELKIIEYYYNVFFHKIQSILNFYF